MKNPKKNKKIGKINKSISKHPKMRPRQFTDVCISCLNIGLLKC